MIESNDDALVLVEVMPADVNWPAGLSVVDVADVWRRFFSRVKIRSTAARNRVIYESEENTKSKLDDVFIIILIIKIIV